MGKNWRPLDDAARSAGVVAEPHVPENAPNACLLWEPALSPWMTWLCRWGCPEPREEIGVFDG